MSGDKIAFAAQQLCTKIRFRCFMVLKRFRKKKEKKEIKGKKRKKVSSRPNVGW